MDDESVEQRLSRIETLWSVVREAHGRPGEATAVAQKELLRRYGGAVYRYLLGALRDRDAAEDLFQEFALRFVRGAFRNADPDKGRFRSFVKSAVFNLIVDHQKRRRVGARALPLIDGIDPADPASGPEEAERAFARDWRDELLARAWKALEEVSGCYSQPYYAVLRLRADRPELSSTQMAEMLETLLGRQVTAASGRQMLHRARESFADLLLDEVAQSLEFPTHEQIEEELGDLGLLDHCRAALDRRAKPV